MTEPRVLAVFGPTASGKSGVAEAIADRIPATLISADAMQVYRGLPILTNQSARETELVAIWDLDHEASVGEYAELAHAAVDGALARETTPVVVGGTGLYLRAALGDLDLPPAPEPGARALGGRVRPARRGGRARAPRGAGSRGSARARERPPSGRPGAGALRGGRLARAERRAALERGDAPPDARRRPRGAEGCPRRRIATRTKQMFESGVEEEVRRALERPISSTARTVHGLSDIAELPPDEAIAALIRRTRRYAAYQRKWMRRIPGLVTVPADRPAGEVADEILEMARTRQRLPAGPAG